MARPKKKHPKESVVRFRAEASVRDRIAFEASVRGMTVSEYCYAWMAHYAVYCPFPEEICDALGIEVDPCA